MKPEKISVIIPVFNELKNLEPLSRSLLSVMAESEEEFELIFIDDGSTDGSSDYLATLSERDDRVGLIQFRRNFGQSAALAAGFDFAGGDVIVTIDADQQNDPQDIPAVLAKLREGYDVVSCWRKHRRDRWLTRRVPSRLANLLISKISGVDLHDHGCTLKGYRRDVVEHIRLYGEMHRFLPIYSYWAGARVTELPVRHHPRVHGSSKYGLSRSYKVILDLVTMKILGSYSTKPMYFFGGIGLISCSGGVLFAVWTLIDKYLNEVKAHRNPLLLLAVLLFIVGIQFILMGVVAELLMRTYFESQGKTPYLIRRTLNCRKQVRAPEFEQKMTIP